MGCFCARRCNRRWMLPRNATAVGCCTIDSMLQPPLDDACAMHPTDGMLSRAVYGAFLSEHAIHELCLSSFKWRRLETEALLCWETSKVSPPFLPLRFLDPVICPFRISKCACSVNRVLKGAIHLPASKIQPPWMSF